MDLWCALNNMYPSQVLINERPKTEQAVQLLEAFDAVCKSGYRLSGNDIYAHQIIELGEYVESSYSRLVVRISVDVLRRLFELYSTDYFDDWGNPIRYKDSFVNLDVFPTNVLAKTVIGETDLDGATIHNLGLKMMAEHEIAARQAAPKKPMRVLTDKDKKRIKAVEIRIQSNYKKSWPKCFAEAGISNPTKNDETQARRLALEREMPLEPQQPGAKPKEENESEIEQ